MAEGGSKLANPGSAFQHPHQWLSVGKAAGRLFFWVVARQSPLALWTTFLLIVTKDLSWRFRWLHCDVWQMVSFREATCLCSAWRPSRGQSLKVPPDLPYPLIVQGHWPGLMGSQSQFTPLDEPLDAPGRCSSKSVSRTLGFECCRGLLCCQLEAIPKVQGLMAALSSYTLI